jgi:hypothetical protein
MMDADGSTSPAEIPAFVGALLFAAAFVVPHISRDLRPLAASVDGIALFALGVALTSVALVTDQALIGLLRSDLQFARNALFAVAKLVALFFVSVWGADQLELTIFATWVLGSLLSLAALAALAACTGHLSRPCRPRWALLRGMGRAVFGHYGLNVALQAPNLALPVLVTVLLSTTMNAYFYAAWMLAGFTFVGPVALAMSLYAVGSRALEALAQRMRFTLALGFGGALLAKVVVLPGAELLLGLFGGAYAEQAGWSWRILVLGMFPLVIKGISGP